MYIRAIKLKRDIPNDNYLYDLDVIRNLKNMGELTFDKPVTFLVGENGIGKSTLIEAIAVNFGFNPEGGTRNYNFRTKSTHSDLCDYMTVVKSGKRAKTGYFLRAESFYNAISYQDYIDVELKTDKNYYEHLISNAESDISRHKMSHGESFLATMNDFMGEGLYILDDPESALSPNGIMKLMSIIHGLTKRNSQFIISTHSPMLLVYPNADIYEIKEDNISKVSYKDTMHYSLTRSFLENPEKMLKYLFEEEV